MIRMRTYKVVTKLFITKNMHQKFIYKDEPISAATTSPQCRLGSFWIAPFKNDFRPS